MVNTPAPTMIFPLATRNEMIKMMMMKMAVLRRTVYGDEKMGDTGEDSSSDDDLSISWLNSKISSQFTLKSFDGARLRACMSVFELFFNTHY